MKAAFHRIRVFVKSAVILAVVYRVLKGFRKFSVPAVWPKRLCKVDFWHSNYTKAFPVLFLCLSAFPGWRTLKSHISLRASSPIWASEARLARTRFATRSRVLARPVSLAQTGELASTARAISKLGGTYEQIQTFLNPERRQSYWRNPTLWSVDLLRSFSLPHEN